MFAVDQPDRWRAFRLRSDGVDPLRQFGSVGVRTVAVQNLYPRTQWHLIAEDLEHWPALHDPSTKRVLRLKADDENGVARVGRAMREMVEDATGLRHA